MFQQIPRDMTEGPTHTNLIFDMVVPRSCKFTDDQVKQEMARMARGKNERYMTVIQVDHSYVD